MDGKPNIAVRSFNCLKCGSPLVIRGMHNTQSVVCGSCASVIDISEGDFKILHEYLSAAAIARHQPLIPLGTRGTLRGEKWEVIGFMRRCITIEGVGYRWSEYLLFNPYRGFRWLTEYNGHWNYVVQCVDHPPERSSRSIRFRGQTFKHFQSAIARVEYALGEFYWRVARDDDSHVSDYVAPPFMLSSEATGEEMSWSLGEYLPAAEIEKAFALKKGLPGAVGVYANQPSPYRAAAARAWKAAGLFVLLALFIQLFSLALAQNRLVHEEGFNYRPADTEKSVVTSVFDVGGRRTNVVIRSTASVRNAWIFLNMALINDDTGTAYDLGREISYYTGRDQDGPWTEGRDSDEVTIAAVPAGHYYLRVEPEGDIATAYRIQVFRDVPSWTYFFITIALLLMGPVVAWILHLSFENRRWAESDHPWSTND
jgi:hypothetical protein